MKITEGVRKFAAERGISEEVAIEKDMEQKAKEFKKADEEIYSRRNVVASAVLDEPKPRRRLLRLKFRGAHAPRVLVPAPSPAQQPSRTERPQDPLSEKRMSKC